MTAAECLQEMRDVVRQQREEVRKDFPNLFVFELLQARFEVLTKLALLLKAEEARAA